VFEQVIDLIDLAFLGAQVDIGDDKRFESRAGRQRELSVFQAWILVLKRARVETLG